MWPFTRSSTIHHEASPEFTPDMFLLEQQERHLVFDYGRTLFDVPKVCPALTVEKMTLWRRRAVQGPKAVALKICNIPKARIGGTLYLMSTEEIVELDKERQNGLHFDRKQVPVQLPYQDETGSMTVRPAWAYIGKPEHWYPTMQWDIEFYRGKGEYSLADTFLNSPLGTRPHYQYTEPKLPFTPSISTYIRDPDVHVMVQKIDAEIRKNRDKPSKNNHKQGNGK